MEFAPLLLTAVKDLLQQNFSSFVHLTQEIKNENKKNRKQINRLKRILKLWALRNLAEITSYKVRTRIIIGYLINFAFQAFGGVHQRRDSLDAAS